MNTNFFKRFHWKRPNLTPEQEIVAGREAAAKGREHFIKMTLSARQKVIGAIICLILIAFMIETFPLPLAIFCILIMAVKIIPHLWYDSMSVRSQESPHFLGDSKKPKFSLTQRQDGESSARGELCARRRSDLISFRNS